MASSKSMTCIWIGKPRKPFFREAADHYLAKLKKWHTIDEICLKDAPGTLPANERAVREGQDILRRVTPSMRVICLDEKGTAYRSRELAGRLRDWIEDPARQPCFVIGGPYGLSDELRGRADETLSLGPGTLPHELARVVLYEQLYRAASILRGTPYHND